MAKRDYLDIISGGALTVFGIIVGLHALTHYNIGTLQRMGPGMFPLAMGGVITLLGAALGLSAMLREGTPIPTVNWRALGAILSSVLSFSLLVVPFGLVPAVLALVMLAGLSESPYRPIRSLILAAVLCAIAVGIFKIGLGMNFAVIAWPFR